MRRIVIIAILAAWPAASQAQPALVRLSDLQVVSQPSSQPYRPDGNLDVGDNGKAFSMICTIAPNGHLSDCYAEPNTLNDQNFVRHGLQDVSQWVVAPALRDGRAAAGRQVRITCRVNQMPSDAPADGESGQRLASN